VAPVRSSRRSLGGLGALFFLGTLGGIAFYVQRQSVPEDRDLVRKAATVLPEVAEDEPPPSLPWKDRLDLDAALLVPLPAGGIGSDARQRAPDPLTPVPASAPPGASAGTATAQEVDPNNARYVQELSDGHRILLTLDPVLQDSALTIFRNREVPYAGAVMIDLRDNAVLVLAGHSSMDTSVEPLEIVASAWAPAASTFKLVTTASLLDAGSATPSTRACFSGGLHGIENEELSDVPGRDTQCETLASAVAHSYNLVIGKLALQHLDQQRLADTARKLLFESDIPFEFNIERSPAHIPNDPIERAKVAAGFWNVDLSPMHGAVMASIFGRGGMYQPPHIIAQVVGPDGTDLTPARPAPERRLGHEIVAALDEMMRATTTVGTARKSFIDKQGNPYIQGVVVAGKTGSLTGKKAPYLNYNWFIGYAPAERPEVAFAVLLANVPAWRIKAHYAARRLVQIYLERRDAITRQRDARLVEGGIELPERDASGTIVVAAQKPGPSEAEGRKPKPDANVAKAQSAHDHGPPGLVGDHGPPGLVGDPPLPPPPGAVPKPPRAVAAPGPDDAERPSASGSAAPESPS
jgi:membrane peptidoglycan carboxypeptidase